MPEPRYHVVWAQAAAEDLAAIVPYIASRSPTSASGVLRKLRQRAEALRTTPDRGRIVPELARFEIRTFRELTVRPYRLLYRVEGDNVVVVGLFDGRRDIEEVLLERLIRNRS